MNRTVYIHPYQPHLGAIKYPGTYTVVGNNLRVSNDLGVNSVKLDDIVSISVKKIKKANDKYFGISVLKGILISIIIVIILLSTPGGSFAFVEAAIFFLFYLFIAFTSIYFLLHNPITWENVLIETTGGSILFFSVENDEGILEVNKLEELRIIQKSI
jgi:hypothetical protein